jgi:transcriptional regulator with XRE-family HTH domain
MITCPRGHRHSASMPTRQERRRLIGGLLRTVRAERGLRQEDVAAQLGRHQSYVSKYESGEQSLDMIEVAEICQVMGMPLNEFAKRLERELRRRS